MVPLFPCTSGIDKQDKVEVRESHSHVSWLKEQKGLVFVLIIWVIEIKVISIKKELTGKIVLEA